MNQICLIRKTNRNAVKGRLYSFTEPDYIWQTQFFTVQGLSMEKTILKCNQSDPNVSKPITSPYSLTSITSKTEQCKYINKP